MTALRILGQSAALVLLSTLIAYTFFGFLFP